MKNLLFIITIFGLVSCSSLRKMNEEFKKEWLKKNCNIGSAYSSGADDCYKGKK